MSHILLVEDRQDLLWSLGEVLAMAGYRVTAASTNAQARAAIADGGFDLIVSDCVLRGGNGDDIRNLANGIGVPVLLMSGEPERIARLRGGPAPFLEKPFRSHELLLYVELLLKQAGK
jgi:two-component system nitrogen regulation response regulator GlnG